MPKVHQRVVKRLVGARRWARRVVGRVPDGKHTNESLNDSLVQEKGRERVVGRVPDGKHTNESLYDSLEGGRGSECGCQ